MRSIVPKRSFSVGTWMVVLVVRSLHLEYVIESVTDLTVMMSGTVTGIAITTGTSVTTVVRAYLLITFVITILTVTMVTMRVTVVM